MTVQNLYVPQVGARSDLNAWINAADGPNRAELYVSNTPYLPTRVLGDYTLASFAGYVPVNPIPWGVTFINFAGKAEIDSSTLAWHYANLVGTATAFGILLTDVAGLNLRCVIPFRAPFVFSPAAADLAYVAQLTAASEL